MPLHMPSSYLYLMKPWPDASHSRLVPFICHVIGFLDLTLALACPRGSVRYIGVRLSNGMGMSFTKLRCGWVEPRRLGTGQAIARLSSCLSPHAGRSWPTIRRVRDQHLCRTVSRVSPPIINETCPASLTSMPDSVCVRPFFEMSRSLAEGIPLKPLNVVYEFIGSREILPYVQPPLDVWLYDLRSSRY